MELRLLGERIALREFRRDDWPAVHAYARLPEVTRYVVWGPNTEQDSQAYVDSSIALAAARPRLAFNLAIELREDGRLVGGCNLTVAGGPDTQAHIGYVLHPDVWGKGLATEAARLLVAYGFDELGLRRVEATCDVRKVASARVLEKAGLSLEATRHHDVLLRGEWRDSLLFGILDDEWKTASTSAR